jgi:hypothetical protein
VLGDIDSPHPAFSDLGDDAVVANDIRHDAPDTSGGPWIDPPLMGDRHTSVGHGRCGLKPPPARRTASAGRILALAASMWARLLSGDVAIRGIGF